MVAAIKRIVKVQPGGIVHFSARELPEGSEAEVIVLLNTRPTSDERLKAFNALADSVALDEDTATKWMAEAADERKAFGP
jgi:hypothetical protein